jgi:hypothetical protein
VPDPRTESIRPSSRSVLRQPYAGHPWRSDRSTVQRRGSQAGLSAVHGWTGKCAWQGAQRRPAAPRPVCCAGCVRRERASPADAAHRDPSHAINPRPPTLCGLYERTERTGAPRDQRRVRSMPPAHPAPPTRPRTTRADQRSRPDNVRPGRVWCGPWSGRPRIPALLRNRCAGPTAQP